MVEIKFDRDSVCMGDDVESHAVSFEIDEKMPIDDLIKFLYSKHNVIARISGGKATWILQLKHGDFYMDIAVFAEQWNSVKRLSSSFDTIGQVIEFYNSCNFFGKYLAQKDPEAVYNILKELRF